MRILITGATGFLGSHLCRGLIREGYQVRILCRPTSSLTRLNGLPFEKAVGDILDLVSVQTATRGCEYVIHAAGVGFFGIRDTEPLTKVNVEGTANVARAARAEKAKRLVHISSAGAIGIPTDPRQPADEDFDFDLQDFGLAYHLSKRHAEDKIQAEVARGLDAVIVNPSVVCGSATRGYRVVEPIKKALKSWFIPYTAGGLCLVHIDDVVQGIALALKKGRSGERYILGGSNVSFKEMIEAVRKEFRLPRLLIPVPPILADAKGKLTNELRRLRGYEPTPEFDRRVRFQFYSSRKAMVELGYRPRDFVAIIREFVAYQRAESLKNGTQQPPLLDVEHPDQLGLKDPGRDGEIPI